MGPPSKIMSEAEKVQTFKNTAMNATIEMQTRVFISTKLYLSPTLTWAPPHVTFL